MKTEAEIQVMRPQAKGCKDCRRHQELAEPQETRRNQPCQHLDFGLLNQEKTHFFPTSLWYFCYSQ